MTDMEITIACAKAFYGKAVRTEVGNALYVEPWDSANAIRYDPMHNDGQAMGLVKKFELLIGRNTNMLTKVKTWGVTCGNEKGDFEAESADLNRAICECVAQMQEAK